MTLYAIEQKWLGLGKESTRGTSTTPTKYFPISADTELDYKLNLIEDELLRGDFEKRPPYSGTKEGSGTINLDVNSLNIGYFLHSLLGNPQNTLLGTLAYKHIFKRDTSISLPSYTITIHRGISTKKYPFSVVKSISFNFSTDNIIKATITSLFKTEEEYTNPPTPSFTELNPLMFYNTTVEVGGTQSNVIKNLTLTIDNGAIPLRVLNGSQDITDIISHAKLIITGSFTIYFEKETERSNFLTNTSSSLEINCTGSQIEEDYNHGLKFTLPQIHYTSYPFGNVDGLLGASVTFNAYYKLSASNSLEIELVNTIDQY